MLLSCPGGGTFKIVTISNIQLKMKVAVVYFDDDIVGDFDEQERDLRGGVKHFKCCSICLKREKLAKV